MTKTYLGINVSHGASAALMVNGEIKVTNRAIAINKQKIFQCINQAN